MSTPCQSPTTRFLRFLKIKTESSIKGNTIKKTTLGAQIGAFTQAKPVPQSTNKDNYFPREYYKPRPIPKSFTVGEVRKVSGDGSPMEARHEVVDSAAATQSQSTVKTTSVESTAACTEKPAITSVRSQPSEGPVSASLVAQSSTVSGVTSSERPPRPTFDLLLGQQDPDSPYLTRRYFSETFIADADHAYEPPDDILHLIPELDPQAFDLFEIYTHTGRLSIRCPSASKADHIWITCWPLINAHILGCIIDEPAFADRVIDTLVEKITPGIAPDLETIQHLFDSDRKNIPKTLRTFVVDRFIVAQQWSVTLLDTSRYPVLFTDLVLQSTLRRLSRHESTAVFQGCRYHIHGDGEVCYKKKLTLNILKEQRLAAARETSARDLAFATANALQNGVKSIDWEQCKLDSSHILRANHESTWPGFQHPENGKPGIESNRDNAPPGDVNSVQFTDRASDGNNVIESTNRTSPTYDRLKTSGSSQVSQSRSSESHHIAAAPLSKRMNGNILPYKSSTSPMVVLGNLQHPSPLAELDGSSINAPQQTELAFNYKPSVERMRVSTSQSAIGLVTNGMDRSSNGTRNSFLGESAPGRRVGELTTEYERCVGCPGAYPDSDVGT